MGCGCVVGCGGGTVVEFGAGGGVAEGLSVQFWGWGFGAGGSAGGKEGLQAGLEVLGLGGHLSFGLGD